LTAAGKLKKSRLEDPTQCNGLSSAARTRRTLRVSQFWDIRASLHGFDDNVMYPSGHFESVIAAMFARISISGDNAWAGCPSGGHRDLELDATAEETMSPIARRPMPSSLPPAA
jgi:hypothetical protein